MWSDPREQWSPREWRDGYEAGSLRENRLRAFVNSGAPWLMLSIGVMALAALVVGFGLAAAGK